MTNGTLGTITVDSAPREADKLANIGRFQLRRLAEALGLCDTEQKKSAFMAGTPNEMAQAVALALKIKDGGSPPVKESNGVNGSNGSNGHAKAEAPAEEPVREPRTETKVRTPATKTAEPKASPMADLKELREMVTQVVDPVNGALVAVNVKLDQIAAVVIGLQEQNKFLFALVGMLSEQVINASRADILGQVAEEAPFVLKDLEYALKKRSENQKAD